MDADSETNDVQINEIHSSETHSSETHGELRGPPDSGADLDGDSETHRVQIYKTHSGETYGKLPNPRVPRSSHRATKLMGAMRSIANYENGSKLRGPQ